MNIKWLLSLTMMLLLVTQAYAIRPIEDFRTPGQIQETVVEKFSADIDALPGSGNGTTGKERALEQIREKIQERMHLDELNQENTMREALRQENLEDRIRGHEDLELAADEKSVDLHLGKVLTDMNGNRVRMEEYILRPADNQVQFLNLTMRDNQLDYVDYNAHFNTALPENLYSFNLWRKSFGMEDPSTYLTQETVRYSNLDDNIDYVVDYFAPTLVTELQSYYLSEKQKTLHINDVFKWGVSRETNQGLMTDMEGAVGIKSATAQFIDKNILAVRETYIFNDDTFLTLERYTIDEDGALLQLRWNNLADWVYWTQHIGDLAFNSYNELVWTASEFDGRNIDIVSQFLHQVNFFEGDGRVWH